MYRVLVSFLVATFLFTSVPFTASAFPFGGQINTYRRCYNTAIYSKLGPPVGGEYIWRPSTLTYNYGPPAHTGQWLLGLASVPYYCVVSVQPVDVWPGFYITMMGSSGPSGAAIPSQQPTSPSNVLPSASSSQDCVLFDWPEDKPLPSGCRRG